MTDFLAYVIAALGMVVLLAVLLIVAPLWSTWWLYPGWEWFVVPLGVTPISFWHMYGLKVFGYSLFVYSGINKPNEGKEEDKTTKMLSAIFVFVVLPIAVWCVMRFAVAML